MGFTQSFIKEKTEKKWHLVDLQGLSLGRAASKIAMILRGKNKAIFTAHEDLGDFVVAINAKQIQLTGNKLTDKMYYHYTNHIGGIKGYSAESLMARKPEELIYRAVKGMLPKTALGHRQIKKLKVYRDSNHPHQSQSPAVLDLKAKY